MKIITDNAAYVQLNDIAFLANSDKEMPASILMKVAYEPIIIDNKNRFQFVKFENQTEIDFFKNLDWLLDYNFLKDLKKSQIDSIYSALANEFVELYIQVQNKEPNHDVILKYEILKFQMQSLRDYLTYKQGRINFEFPDEFPNGNVKGIKKLIRIFYPKK